MKAKAAPRLNVRNATKGKKKKSIINLIRLTCILRAGVNSGSSSPSLKATAAAKFPPLPSPDKTKCTRNKQSQFQAYRKEKKKQCSKRETSKMA